MPSVFVGNADHTRLLEKVRQIRSHVYATYGDPSSSTFVVDQELGENLMALHYVTEARNAFAVLGSKFVNGSEAERTELRAYNLAMEDVASYFGSGWIDQLHHAVDFLVDVVENGV